MVIKKEQGGEPFYDPKRTMWLRPETSDQIVIDTEVGGYVRRLGVGPGARVLDVGAHIGAATLRFVRAGADLVVAIAIEPDPENYDLLIRNCPIGHLPFHAAAVGDDRTTVTLWHNPGRGKSLHSLRERRGRRPVEVPAMNIGQLCRDYAITHVKIDTEGSEYELVSEFPESVRRLAIEFHANDTYWRDRLPGAIEVLKEQGFVPDRQPESTAWNWIVGWGR